MLGDMSYDLALGTLGRRWSIGDVPTVAPPPLPTSDEILATWLRAAQPAKPATSPQKMLVQKLSDAAPRTTQLISALRPSFGTQKMLKVKVKTDIL